MLLFKKKLIKIDRFLVSAIILVFSVAVLTSLHLWGSYTNLEKVRLNKIELQSDKVATELDNTFTYISNVIAFLGRKIKESKTNDYDYISSLFSEQFITNQQTYNFFSWTGFDWTNADGMLVVSTVHGVMPKPIDMNFRNYVQKASANPGVLHFDPPSYGKTSKQWVIPAGIGFTGSNYEYAGLVSVGININEFGKKLENTLLSNGLRYALLDANKNIIHASNILFEDFERLEAKIKFEIPQFTESQGFLNSGFSFGNTDFSYYKKIDNYPYIVLIGYDSLIAKEEFYSALEIGSPQIILLGLLSLILIFGLRYIVVQPVKELSQIADDVVNKGVLGKLPRSSSYEINNLSKKIINLHRLIRKKEITKKELQEAHRIIKESEVERESFLKDMHRALHIPISAIMNGVVLIKREQLGEINHENYALIFDALYDASKQLETLTTEFLYPSKVDIADMLNKCIVLQRRYAVEKGIGIKLRLSKNIPEIWADRLRFRQVVLSTIYHAMLYTPSNDDKTIIVSANVEKSKEDNSKWLNIIIEDDGFGVDEGMRLTFWDKHFNGSESLNRDPNMMNVDIKTLRHLVALHYGTFHIKKNGKQGTVFTIRIPYLSREVLELPLDVKKEFNSKTQGLQKMLRDTMKQSTNIIKFPSLQNDKNEDKN